MKKLLFIGLLAILVASAVAIDPNIIFEPNQYSITAGESKSFDLYDYTTRELPNDNYNLSYRINYSGEVQWTARNFGIETDYTDGGHTYAFTVTVFNYSNQGGADTVYIHVDHVKSMTVSSPILGGSDKKRARNYTASFKITNTGSVELSDITVTSDAEPRYKVTFTDVPTSLDPGEEAIVYVQGYIPLDFDAVDEEGNKAAFKIGDITVRGTAPDENTISAVSILNMEAENNLEFDDFYITVNGDEDRVNDGDKVSDLRPEDKIDISATVQNDFSTSGDCEVDGGDCNINNVRADLTIDEDHWSVDERLDFGDVDSDDNSDDSLGFDVDEDADDRTFSMDVVLTGRDDNGARHGEHWTIKMEVNREDHEITIVDFAANPASLECNERNFVVAVKIKNTGSRDESKVTLDIENRRLGIIESIARIDLDQDSSTTKYFDITLPDGVQPGNLYFDIITYYSGDEESDRQTFSIYLDDCQTTTTTATPTTTQKIEVIELPPATGVYYGKPAAKQGFFDSKEYILLLVMAVLIVLLLIALLLAVLVRR